MKLCDNGKKRFNLAAIEGSAAYLAPEVLLHDNDFVPASDVWAMCCTAIQWFTGRCPWSCGVTDVKTIRAKQKEKAEPDELRNVPLGVRKILKRGLNYSAVQRPSAGEMKHMLSK